MSIESDIRSTPDVVRQTLQVTAQAGEWSSGFGRPAVFLGSGSSYCIALAAAYWYEETFGVAAQAMLPSEYHPRAEWLHIGLSRTGQTTELIDAMRRARGAGAEVLLIAGDEGSDAQAVADRTLALPFAAEEGVVQTRFITACLTALRALITREDLSGLPDAMDRAVEFDTRSLDGLRVVYLGRHWRYGLARSAALTLQESALEPAESHQTLDYRHGPIACADSHTLVWCFDPLDDQGAEAVLRDVEATDARVRQTSVDPLVSLVQAQWLAARRAADRGIDPEAPRHLSRAIILPGAHG
jgi:glutamine---fructose-6-phosphate transaminase (isomerizing)